MKNGKSTLIGWLFWAGLVVFALAGCGGGGGGSIADVDPSGYYYGLGSTATVKAEDGTDLVIGDLQAMVDVDSDGGRIMMMGTGIIDEVDQLEARFLYDGTMIITEKHFEAEFIIYTTEILLATNTDGQNPITATASGTIVEGKSITGTLVSSEGGVGNGTFSLNYAVSNNQAANISRIENGPDSSIWMALIGGDSGGFGQRFAIDNVGLITHIGSGGGIFRSCEMAGTMTPINTTSLYSVSLTLMSCRAGGGLPNGTYTGLAASRTQTNLDDTLLFAVTNGIYSPNEDFERGARF